MMLDCDILFLVSRLSLRTARDGSLIFRVKLLKQSRWNWHLGELLVHDSRPNSAVMLVMFFKCSNFAASDFLP